MESKLYYDLLEVIEMRQDMINRQNELIAKLVNENLEKENMISVLNEQEKYLY